ncbi:sm-like protein LSM3A [Phragmites australis]|uniref:sm-like protein LSM3A n=1 Tax=Phragmites australis TaxID=29695 RepID=UPI002D78CE0C|nr:sm-like protein LSM3A [Phragmites australis]
MTTAEEVIAGKEPLDLICLSLDKRIYVKLRSNRVLHGKLHVRSLIQDIRDVRFHKVETGLETISGRTHAVKENMDELPYSLGKNL